jgi:cyclophilin family peptidyl-prolyl cis-trans isomerase
MKCKTLVFCLLAMVCICTTLRSQEINQMVLITTSYGNIKMKLYDNTPQHRDNFIRLTRKGFFNGLLFHRIINNFVIQGGDPDSKNAKAGDTLGNGGPGYDIPAEFVAENWHKRGAVGAARENDDINPERKSSGSQFYIVVGKVSTDHKLDSLEIKYNKKFTLQQREVYKTIGGTPHLDGRYVVFGEVVEGMDVVDIISKLPRDGNDRPLEDVKMEIKVVESTK